MGKFASWALALIVCIPFEVFGFEPTGEKAQFVHRENVRAPLQLTAQSWSEGEDASIAVHRDGTILTDTKVPADPNVSFSKEFEGTLPNELDSWSVHGSDERTRIHNTSSFPYRSMGMLANGCTGTLIGPRHVLTAAHCVYDTKRDKWESNLDFSPGRNGSGKPYGRFSWETALTVTGYTKNHRRIHDYAMVILKEPAGDKLGWMGYGHESSLGSSTKVNINGYPEDKDYGTLWHSFCGLRDASTYWLTYYCDTEGGMSGSGVYRYLNGNRTILAVHTYGGNSYNSATRITKSKFAKLRSWKEKYR